MDDDNRPDRRNNNGIYQRLDKLEDNVYKYLSDLKEDDAALKTKIELLTYQVGVIIAAAKVVAGSVVLAIIAALLRLIFIQ